MPEVYSRRVLNQQVIDVIHGVCLGNVQAIYFDTHLQGVTAISLGHDAYGNHGIIRHNDLVMFGEDVTLVRHPNVAVVAENISPEWLSDAVLIGAEVQGLTGERAGTVDNVLCDRDTLALVNLAVRLGAIGEVVIKFLPITAVRAMSYNNSLIVDLNVLDDWPAAL